MHRPRTRTKSRTERRTQARFVALFDANARDLLAYFLRRLPDRADAADALADTFVVVWRRIDDVPDGDGARPWLFGVARLTLQNERRRVRRADALAQRLRDELVASAPRAQHTAITVDTQAVLAQLDADDRELLMLVGWDGLTPTEAAAVLDINPGAARVRLHRARRRVQMLVEDIDTVAALEEVR